MLLPTARKRKRNIEREAAILADVHTTQPVSEVMVQVCVGPAVAFGILFWVPYFCGAPHLKIFGFFCALCNAVLAVATVCLLIDQPYVKRLQAALARNT